jgi:hypothetical protein
MSSDMKVKNYFEMDRFDFCNCIIGCLLCEESRMVSVRGVEEWLGVGLHAQLGILSDTNLVEMLPVKCGDGKVRQMHFVAVDEMARWFGKVLESKRSKRTQEEMIAFVNDFEEVVGEFYHNLLYPPVEAKECRTPAEATQWARNGRPHETAAAN